MNFRITFTLFVLLSYLNAEPTWFNNIPKKEYEFISYGVGSSFEEASAIAKAEIASYIRSDVISKLSIKSSEINDESNEEVKSEISSVSNISLYGVKTIKREEIKDRYFVALKYDLRAFETKFVEKIGSNKKCTKKRSFLNNSLFGESLRTLVNCDLDLSIYEKGGTLFISNNNISMPWDKNDIETLFVEKQDIDLHFTASKFILKDNEAFKLILKSNKQGGYLSLFNIYNQGEVALLVDNIPNSFGKTIKIPDAINESLELVASTEGKDNTKDLYIAVWHEKKLSLSIFDMTSDETLSNNSNKNLSELIKILDKNSYSSFVVRISK
ncbi:LPP20 family lipoprotein [Aliarcobacter thereius]|uniref:LPP20 family lipoprotein n=1 Tax=Aliarcobacter thereius TaxID=544718 RepID=UPI000824AE87|nr:LPP20 family lipoprotein [Aliarcobacter thereius]OCL93956.1 hypothetical protein AAX25_00278 [Aliarcobacter thereius]